MSNERVGRLDVVRGLAFLIIIAYHCNVVNLPWYGSFRWYQGLPLDQYFFLPLSELGYTAVSLFFVLSGYCLHYNNRIRQKNLSASAFMMNRVRRIYPTYTAALVVYSFIAFWSGTSNKALALQITTHFLFIHNLLDSTFYGLCGPLWSLAIEWQFYILYALLIRSFVSVLSAYRASLCLNVILYIASIHTIPLPLFPGFILPLFFVNNWLCGAYLAECKVEGTKMFPYPRFCVVVFATMLVISWNVKELISESFLFASLLYGCLMESYLSMPGKLSNTELLASKCGIISYSGYLWHPLLLDNIRYFLNLHDWKTSSTLICYGILFPSTVALLLILATVSWYYLEKSFQLRPSIAKSTLSPAAIQASQSSQ